MFIDFGNSNTKVFFNNMSFVFAYPELQDNLESILKIKRTDKVKVYFSNVKKIDISFLFNQIDSHKVNFELFDVRYILEEICNNRYHQDSEFLFDFSSIQGIGTDRLLGLFILSFFCRSTFFNVTKKIVWNKIVVFDFGTAITANVIHNSGEVEGGLIIPGLFTQIQALNLNTAQIEVDFRETLNSVLENNYLINLTSSNTKDAVINGAVVNILGFLRIFIQTLNSGSVDLTKENLFFFTGSYSNFFYKETLKYLDNQTQQNIFYIQNLNLMSLMFISKFKQ